MKIITDPNKYDWDGKFLNLKTDNWSISGIEDLKLVIDDFNKRTGNEDISNT